MLSEEIINKFKNREVKAKEIFDIRECSKNDAFDFVKTYHYLGDAKFFSMYSYGLYDKQGSLVGVATYAPPQGAVALKGWFGIEDNSVTDILELSRLAMLPTLNGTNATSFLLGNSMKMLHKTYNIRAITTLATTDRHVGSIYQVCNFTYYGMTDKKSDFFVEDEKQVPSREMPSNNRGVWVNRPRKHRYAYIFDKSLKCLYTPTTRPILGEIIKRECCEGKGIVHDNRFNVDYYCPICGKYQGRNNTLHVYKDYDVDVTKQITDKLRTICDYNKYAVNNIQLNINNINLDELCKELMSAFQGKLPSVSKEDISSKFSNEDFMNRASIRYSEKFNCQIAYSVNLFGNTLNDIVFLN